LTSVAETYIDQSESIVDEDELVQAATRQAFLARFLMLMASGRVLECHQDSQRYLKRYPSDASITRWLETISPDWGQPPQYLLQPEFDMKGFSIPQGSFASQIATFKVLKALKEQRKKKDIKRKDM
jgi:hypothetical protein